MLDMTLMYGLSLILTSSKLEDWWYQIQFDDHDHKISGCSILDTCTY